MAKIKQAASGDLQLDVRFMLANCKAQILYSGFSFEWDEQDANLTNFFNVLQNHNDWLKILHTTEIQNSVYGKSYLFFDMLAGSIPKIGVYEYNSQNQCLKIDGENQVYIQGSRVLMSGANGIKTKIWEFRTPNSTKRIIQAGSTFTDTIPVGIGGTIKTPEIVKNYIKNNEIVVNDFTAMTAMELLNKNYIDLGWNNEEQKLADDYSAQDLRDLINRKLNWIDSEMDLNHTRVIGMFDNQSINQMESAYNAKRKSNPWATEENFGQSVIRNKLILQSRGTDADVEVQETNLNVESYINGLNKLIELYFQASGLDYGLTLGSGQKTVAEVQTTYKRTYETIKATNQLRTKQLTKFIENIMIACKLNPTEYKGKWKVKIISEILNDNLQSPDTVLNLYNNRLMTEKHAIQTLNPNFNSYEVSAYIEELEQEKQKEQELNQNSYIVNDSIKQNDNDLQNQASFQGEVEQTENSETNTDNVEQQEGVKKWPFKKN